MRVTRRTLFNFLQITIRVQRRHAAGAGGGDRLAIDMILHVAGGEHARNTGGGGIALVAGLGLDVTAVHFQLPLEEGGVGGVTDGDEHALHGEFLFLAALVLDAQAGDAVLVTEDFVHFVVPFDGYVAALGFGHELVDENRLGLECVAPVHHGDMGSDVGQIYRLFHGGVAAADDGDFLSFKEESVTGGAAGHAFAF